MSDPNAENNDRAVVISESIEFCEALLTVDGLPADAVTMTLDRRDMLRESIRPTEEPAPSNGFAEEGYTVPESQAAALAANVPAESEAYDDEDDDVAELAEDADHEFQPDRGGAICLICEQPQEACEQEP